MSTKRVLAVVRLSRESEDSTSVERQTQRITEWAKFKGWDIVGWAVDDGVSAIKVSPWDRPQLGPWLAKAHEYDGIVCWKIDRLSRRTKDFIDLLHWADENKISIHTTDEEMDLSSDVGRMVAQILAIFADFEGRTIKARRKSSYDHLMQLGRFPGGNVPYGYRKIKRPGQPGWWLTIDPEPANIVREVFERFTGPGREAVRTIVRDLNDRGVLTPADMQRKQHDKPIRGTKWHDSTLANVLRNVALLGWRTQDGEILKDPETGMPLQVAEAILTRAEWDLLQKTLEESSNPKGPNRHGKAPLLGVVFCGTCKGPVYRRPVRSKFNYRCQKSRTGNGCDQRDFRAAELESLVFQDFLARVGKLEVQRKIFQPGEDHTEELETARASSDELLDMLTVTKSADRRERIKAQISALDERIARLESLPNRPAGYVLEGTGETFVELFARLDSAGRGKALREAGVVAYVARHPEGLPILSLALPEDMEDRVREWAAAHAA
jgi:site-specific DNA recombinase